MIVLGAVMPHGDPAFAEGSPTRAAMEELGRRAEDALPDAYVVVTPHNVHASGHFGVVGAGRVAGTVDEGDLRLALAAPCDRELAAELLGALRAAVLPAVSLSFGSNDETLAVHPLDWGALIPLWFLPRGVPVVLVSPARDLALADHVRAGEALAAATGEKRVLLVASADHGHRHDPAGPFGYDPASAEYDEEAVRIVGENRLGELDRLERLVAAAGADSLWQLAVLHGALGDRFEAELLSYEAPTYFGMLCAAFAPR